MQAALASIVGDGGASYHYTPDAVLRAVGFSKLCLDGSLDTIYVLSPQDVAVERRDICSDRALMRVYLTAIHKYDKGVENPFEQKKNAEELRWTVQTRLDRDIRKRLRVDEQLGGVSLEVSIPLTTYAPEETFLEGWACVFAVLEIKYQYQKVTP